jgi:peptide/nickel transport system substrate-binding protein
VVLALTLLAPAEHPLAVAPADVLRIADFSDVTTFDPALTQVTQAGYLYPVYDTLVRQSADHQLVPHLATGWEQTSPTALRFTLRDDVVFHDGSPFDASVVKANLERAKASTGNPNASTFATMSEVVVVDPTTVDVIFSAPSPPFLIEMSMVQGMMVSPAAIAGDVDLTREPHGSGPWIWDPEASQDGVRQVYRLNERYWQPELQGVDRIEISVVADNQARLAALQSGQVDVVYTAAADQVGAAEDGGFTVHALDLDAHWIQIVDRQGARVPALADARVREAIAHAIDRNGYVAAVYRGVGSASGGLISPALGHWYDEALADVPTFDPELSRRLLSDAGYPDGFDIELPTMPVIQANVEAVAQMLADVGIRADLVQLQNGQLGGEIRAGSVAITLGLNPQYHPYQHLALFASSFSPYNAFDLDDTAAVDAALARAASQSDEEARATYAEIERAVIEAGIMIPVAFEPVVNLTAADVEGVFIPLGVRNAFPYGVRVDSQE